MLLVALKDETSSRDDMKENLLFKQSQLSFLNKQNSKEQLRLVISSIRVGVVAKVDDDVLHVLSTIKTYSYFSFVFSFVPKKVDLLEIAKMM